MLRGDETSAMDQSLPDLDLRIPEISQVAVVVDDLDDGIARFGGMLGVGPFEVYRFEPPRLTETTYHGEPHDYSMALALADVGGTMLELIEPLAGESIYTDHLDAHGEGLHHVACFAFEHPEAVVEEFETAGYPVLQSGTFAGTPYWYFDTAEAMNGVIFETADTTGGLPAPDRTVP